MIIVVVKLREREGERQRDREKKRGKVGTDRCQANEPFHILSERKKELNR